MSDQQLQELQQQLFFEFGFKVDIYHFERLHEIAVVKHGEPLILENVIKSYQY